VSGHTCPERLLLPEALSGRLEPAEEKRVMAHLETCSACQDAAADIEIALVSLAVAREAAQPARPELVPSGSPLHAVEPASPTAGATGPVAAHGPAASSAAAHLDHGEERPDEPIPLRRRRTVRRSLLVAAAAVALVAGGAAAGHDLLPPRDSVHYGPPLALAPPAGATDTAARGSVKIGVEADALAVRLTARSLPTTGWYECVWIAGGQTRSAGSFRSKNGAVDVELRVAPPAESGGWDLQVVRHDPTGTHVVLEGIRYPT
jgi:hypothetical protein